MSSMPLRAQVKNGRLVLDEPTELPEGAIVELVPFEDELDEEDRLRLHAAVDRGIEAWERGEAYSAEEVIAHLRAQR